MATFFLGATSSIVSPGSIDSLKTSKCQEGNIGNLHESHNTISNHSDDLALGNMAPSIQRPWKPGDVSPDFLATLDANMLQLKYSYQFAISKD